MDSLAVYSLGTLPTDSPGKLDILGHDGDTLSVDGTQVSVFKEPNKVSFRGLLRCQKSTNEPHSK